MEIYTLTISLLSFMESESNWTRVLEIPEDASLWDLHETLQQTIEFDDDHLFEFYTGKHFRKRDRVFGMEDDFSDEQPESLLTHLNEIYPLTGMKLYYHFDFGDSWMFEIKKGRKKKHPEKGVKYPRVIESLGENPEQYPEY